MNSKCFVLLAFAFLGASAAPLVSTAPVALNNVHGGVGPTVSETVITPYHRTDSVSSPCGHSVVRTTALPVVSYGLTRGGSGFLGTTATGLYQGGLTGIGAGVPAISGVVAGGLAGSGSVLYPGIAAGGLVGSSAGVYNGVGTVAGVGSTGILGGGLGVYPATGVVV